MEIFFGTILAFLFLWFFYLIWMLVRYEVAYRNRCKIIDAAYDYACNTQQYLMFSRIVDAMESMEETASRWLDFGYKNILPKIYYEMVEPYIR